LRFEVFSTFDDRGGIGRPRLSNEYAEVVLITLEMVEMQV